MEDFDDSVQYYIDEGMSPEEAHARVMSYYFGGEPSDFMSGEEGEDEDEHY